MHPLVAEAMKKAAVAWLGVADHPPYPVWCLWVEDALYLVSGGDEQPAPGLASARAVTVTARGDHGGRIVTWSARAERVRPETEVWVAVAPALAAKRLNSAGAAQLVDRWATQSVLSRLAPTGEPPAELPHDCLAAPVPPTPAARPTTKPFRLHRVRQRHR